MENKKIIWRIYANDNSKFPYKIIIYSGRKKLLALVVQDMWPGQKGNCFCLRESSEDKNGKKLEEVNVVSFRSFGVVTAVVLDRARNKRCDFLFVKKKYKTKEGEYEQIFWRTQKALRDNRPTIRVVPSVGSELEIIIDSNEKYPWEFGKSTTTRAGLKFGDYALKIGDDIKAVVERKTLDNMLAHFRNLPALNQQLIELASLQNNAFVIEANYSDFLNPLKNKYYNSAFSAKVFAELAVLHPNIHIVFAGTRKLAKEWTLRFFEVCFNQEKMK